MVSQVPALQLPGVQQVQQQLPPVLIPIPSLAFVQMDWTTFSSVAIFIFLLLLIAIPLVAVIYIATRKPAT